MSGLAQASYNLVISMQNYTILYLMIINNAWMKIHLYNFVIKIQSCIHMVGVIKKLTFHKRSTTVLRFVTPVI